MKGRSWHFPQPFCLIFGLNSSLLSLCGLLAGVLCPCGSWPGFRVDSRPPYYYGSLAQGLLCGTGEASCLSSLRESKSSCPCIISELACVSHHQLVAACGERRKACPSSGFVSPVVAGGKATARVTIMITPLPLITLPHSPSKPICHM